MSGGDEIHVDVHDDGVAVVTVDRPEVRNAFGWQTWPDLADALQAVDLDDNVGAVVITGANGVFSSGGDLKSFGARGTAVTAPAARLRLVRRAFGNLQRMSKPSIAAVEGYAVGGAWSLVLLCTTCIAGRSAFFAAPFADRGLVPDGGIMWTLPRLIGRTRAAELLLDARRVSAEEAEGLGLVREVVDDGSALTRSMQIARDWAEGPRDSISLTMSMLRLGTSMPFDDFLEQEYLGVALNAYGGYAEEGRQAFLEKRDPDFARARPHTDDDEDHT